MGRRFTAATAKEIVNTIENNATDLREWTETAAELADAVDDAKDQAKLPSQLTEEEKEFLVNDSDDFTIIPTALWSKITDRASEL
jgi:hypothetical protein